MSALRELELSRAAGERRGLDLIAVWAPVIALTTAAVHELLYNHAAPWTYALTLGLVVPLLWRRRAPVPVFGVCLTVATALWATGTSTVAALSLLVAIYTVAAHRGLRTTLMAAAALACGVVLAAVRFAPSGSVDDALGLLGGLVAAALFLGTTVRGHRQQLQGVTERSQRLERERAQELRLAAAAERTRIAREMHDVVAHGLSVVITLSEGAAASAAGDPDGSAQIMRQVAGAGRQALVEMRRLLDILRTDDEVGRAPQPDLAALAQLVADVHTTGLDVQLTRTGNLDRLSPTAQAALYRIVQEALTNVIKHGSGASSARVAIELAPPILAFEICDDGAAPGAYLPGNGLTGMRERVGLFDGNLYAGPGQTGWEVRGEMVVGASM